MVDANFPEAQMEAPVIMAMVPSTGTFSAHAIAEESRSDASYSPRASSTAFILGCIFQLPLGLEVSEKT